jgi:hypothetical protein
MLPGPLIIETVPIFDSFLPRSRLFPALFLSMLKALSPEAKYPAF